MESISHYSAAKCNYTDTPQIQKPGHITININCFQLCSCQPQYPHCNSYNTFHLARYKFEIFVMKPPNYFRTDEAHHSICKWNTCCTHWRPCKYLKKNINLNAHSASHCCLHSTMRPLPYMALIHNTMCNEFMSTH